MLSCALACGSAIHQAIPVLPFPAKKIVNKAVVNEDNNFKLVEALKGEVDELRRMLAEKEGALGIAPPKPETRVERVEVEVYRDNPELQAEIAALRIQNSLRSKLMNRLQDQWSQRLQSTAEAAADREEALKVWLCVGVRRGVRTAGCCSRHLLLVVTQSMGMGGPGGFAAMTGLGAAVEGADEQPACLRALSSATHCVCLCVCVFVCSCVCAHYRS